MPWTCPVCHQPLNHDQSNTPIPGVVYRCYVCRLDLVVDNEMHRLIAAEHQSQRPSTKRNRGS